MSIVKSNALWPSTSFFDDLLTRDFFNRAGLTNQEGSLPRVNIVETDNEFKVSMAAPGMKKDDFQVSLDNDVLTISSETSTEKEDYKENFTRREFNYQSFSRSFHLPNTVDAEKIEATYREGILTLTIPKKEEVKKKTVKTITIS